MALDHYVSQVHLRRFYCPSLENRTHAIRKDSLKKFTPRARDICRIDEGSSNAYLLNARAIEEFLKTIEPKYNAAVEALLTDKIDRQSIYTIAGFVAYTAACAPTSMRLGVGTYKHLIGEFGKTMDSKGMFPSPPPALGSKTFTKMLEDGDFEIEVDGKYPQAVGISNILQSTALFGNFKWDILVNDLTDTEFFSCDYPAAVEVSSNQLILNRIVPLAPNLAIRIRPDPRINKAASDFTFKTFGYRRCSIKKQEAIALNRLLVRCAENEVYYRTSFPWIDDFVRHNRLYRLETISESMGPPGRRQLMTGHRIVKKQGGV